MSSFLNNFDIEFYSYVRSSYLPLFIGLAGKKAMIYEDSWLFLIIRQFKTLLVNLQLIYISCLSPQSPFHSPKHLLHK